MNHNKPQLPSHYSLIKVFKILLDTPTFKFLVDQFLNVSGQKPFTKLTLSSVGIRRNNIRTRTRIYDLKCLIKFSLKKMFYFITT